MGWFHLLWTILFAGSVSCQELTTLLPQDDDACMRNDVTFNCTVRGSLTLRDLVLAWSSLEYIGQGDPLRLTTQDTPGANKTSMINRNVTAILISNTRIGGVPELVSELHVVGASQTSVITCTSESNQTSTSTTFTSSAFPGRPQNGEARERSAGSCDFLVTWDRPTNVDRFDIDRYIVYIPSQNIMEESSSTTIDLNITNCRVGNNSIQVAAVNRLGCVGPNSSHIMLSLMENVPSGGLPARVVGGIVGGIIALFVLIGIIILLNILICFPIVTWCVANNQEFKNRMVQDTLVKRDLEKFYNALKLKLPSTKMQVAARDLRETLMLGMESSEFNEKVKAAARDLTTTLMLGRESSKFNEKVKEEFIKGLKALQSENDEVVQRVTENMDNTLTGMTGIDEKFKESVRLLRTNIGTGEHKKVLDDLIKTMEKAQPKIIMSILLLLCEKLRNVQQLKDYYCKQSKHDFDKLGTKEDRVSVPIWMDGALDHTWKDNLREAVQAINEAAPGLSLSIIEDEKQAIIHVLATDKKDSEPYTEVEGNILNMRLKEKNFVTKIRLGKWKDDGKKGVCIHELLHALGFHHDHQDAIAAPYIYHLDSGKPITINKNELLFIWWESSTTTLYPCEKECREHSELGHVCKWVLKEYPIKVNTDLDEHDRVGLNLAYPPCVDKTANNVRYRPKLGKTRMYYCGRAEVVLSHDTPKEEYSCPCGPDKGPNCSACRTIMSPRVEEILNGGRWQGMSGKVYCGRPFTGPGILFPTHDGICGMSNGPACPECENILDKEHDIVQSASDHLASVQ